MGERTKPDIRPGPASRTIGWGDRAVTFNEVTRGRWEAERGGLAVVIDYDDRDDLGEPWKSVFQAISYGEPKGAAGLREVTRHHISSVSWVDLDSAMVAAREFLIENAPGGKP